MPIIPFFLKKNSDLVNRARMNYLVKVKLLRNLLLGFYFHIFDNEISLKNDEVLSFNLFLIQRNSLMHSEKSFFINPSSSSSSTGKSIDLDFASMSDFDVWETFVKGDKNAFAYIYNKYVQNLFAFGCQVTSNREIVKDCIQNLFIDIAQKGINSKAKVKSIKSYLYKSLYRRIIDLKRKENRYIILSSSKEDNNFQISLSHEHNLIKYEISQEKKAVLENQLNLLPKRQREALVLYYYEGFSYTEIAEIMSLKKVNSARKLIYKAIDRIKSKVSSKVFWGSVILLLVGLAISIKEVWN